MPTFNELINDNNNFLTRAQLQPNFRTNSIPEQPDFFALIHNMLSRSEDGVFKTDKTPLSILATDAPGRNVLDIYADDVSDPAWRLGLSAGGDLELTGTSGEAQVIFASNGATTVMNQLMVEEEIRVRPSGILVFENDSEPAWQLRLSAGGDLTLSGETGLMFQADLVEIQGNGLIINNDVLIVNNLRVGAASAMFSEEGLSIRGREISLLPQSGLGDGIYLNSDGISFDSPQTLSFGDSIRIDQILTWEYSAFRNISDRGFIGSKFFILFPEPPPPPPPGMIPLDSAPSFCLGYRTNNTGIAKFESFFAVRNDGRVYMPSIRAASGGTAFRWQSHGEITRLQSSLRYKNSFEKCDNDDVLNILKIQTYQFNYIEEEQKEKDIGFLAEDLHALGLRQLVFYDEKGRPESIHYEKLGIYLLAVLQRHEEKLFPNSPYLKRYINKDIELEGEAKRPAKKAVSKSPKSGAKPAETPSEPVRADVTQSAPVPEKTEKKPTAKDNKNTIIAYLRRQQIPFSTQETKAELLKKIK